MERTRSSNISRLSRMNAGRFRTSSYIGRRGSSIGIITSILPRARGKSLLALASVTPRGNALRDSAIGLTGEVVVPPPFSFF
jgi:hypothetical protein